MRTHGRMAGLAVVFLAAAFCAVSSWAGDKRLTYQQVYRRGEPLLTGPLPKFEGWLDQSAYLESMSERRDGKEMVRFLKVDALTGEKVLYLDESAADSALPAGLSIGRNAASTPDRTGYLFEKDNDIWYFSTATKQLRQLTATPSPEKNPRFSPDGRKVAYTRDNNLYVVDIETGLEKQLTNDGSSTVYNGWASWVYYEEILGRRSRYAAFWWSPQSDRIAFLRFDDSPVPLFTLTSADGIHGEVETQRYPKAGDPNPKVRLGVAGISDAKIAWVDDDPGSDRYVAFPFWTPDGKSLFFQWMNRSQDRIKILSANPSTGKTAEVYSESHPAWVEFFEDLVFFRDGNGFLLRSSADGRFHLYIYDINGRLKNRLTRGDWDVRKIVLVDEANRWIYFEGSRTKSVENHLNRVDFSGKRLETLTPESGSHETSVSPGGRFFIDTWTSLSQPRKMELRSGDGTLIRVLGDSRLPVMDEYALGKAELFTIPSGDGFALPAFWALPPDFDPGKKYPVLFEIYSGPGSSSVSDRFPSLESSYMAQNGIIVLSVDHRGSGHFGKRGQALMHRNLGKWEMVDLCTAVKWLRTKSFVDTTKIGITGGSYGGYATCMALTLGSDFFTHGIAEYSVTDWRLYDNVYTERYMDTPAENPEGYTYGSVMTHAEKYRGILRIVHGTMDDNVHMQNSIQLIDKLEDLNKDFEVMVYPNARHGVGGVKRDHNTREAVQFWFRHFLNRELSESETGPPRSGPNRPEGRPQGGPWMNPSHQGGVQ